MIWSMDGFEWDIPCSVTRTAEMTASEISGVLLDKTYFNDVIGTYMSYDISIAVPFGMENEYTRLYEYITEPVDAHDFVLPYGQTVIQVTGRVSSVSDQYVYMDKNRNYWKGFSFQVIANHPSKTMSLGEVIERGMTPFPSEINIPDGTIYEWDASLGAWMPSSYVDADEVYY